MKKLSVMILIVMLVISAVPVHAADNGRAYSGEDVIYEREITVTEKGGVFQVGFTTIKFPKGFIDKDQLPVTINVKITAVNGIAGIEFTPDIPDFKKEVIVNVHSYNGLIYDETLDKNINVRIKQQKLILEHFSRYAFL